MRSNPITRRAGTDYGSAPATGEVTKDAKGTTPAKFERMQPVAVTKQVIVETDIVKDDDDNALDASAVQTQGEGTTSESYQTKNVDQAKSGLPQANDPIKYMKGLYQRFGDSVTTDELINKKYISKNMRDQYESITGGANKGVRQQIDSPGEIVTSFDYKPIEKTVDTNTLSEGRRISRLLKGDARRATKMENKVARLERRRDRKGENTRAYKRLDRKLKNFKKVETSLNAQLDKNTSLIDAGVNPYSRPQAKINKKAPDARTREEFESTYDFTPKTTSTTSSNITFSNVSSNPTERMVSNVLNAMENDQSKAQLGSGVPKKSTSPIYKMGGYGSKTYK